MKKIRIDTSEVESAKKSIYDHVIKTYEEYLEENKKCFGDANFSEMWESIMLCFLAIGLGILGTAFFKWMNVLVYTAIIALILICIGLIRAKKQKQKEIKDQLAVLLKDKNLVFDIWRGFYETELKLENKTMLDAERMYRNIQNLQKAEKYKDRIISIKEEEEFCTDKTECVTFKFSYPDGNVDKIEVGSIQRIENVDYGEEELIKVMPNGTIRHFYFSKAEDESETKIEIA